MPAAPDPADPSDAAAAAGLRARSLRLALPAVAGLAALWVLWQQRADGATLPPLVPARLPVYFALVGTIVALHALRWRTVLTRLAAPPPLARLMQLWLAARAVGSLIPSGTLAGEPLRAYLVGESGVRRSIAAGTVALDRALELAGNMIAGPASLGAAALLGAGVATGASVAVAALAGLALLALLWLRGTQGRPALTLLLGPPGLARQRGFRWLGALHARAAEADASLHALLAAHPGLVPLGIGISLVIEVLHLLELAALFALFGLAVPLPLLLVSSVGIGIARSVPVPAALGSLEAVQLGIFTIGGRPIALGLAVALALRAAETLWILVGLACLGGAPARRVRT